MKNAKNIYFKDSPLSIKYALNMLQDFVPENDMDNFDIFWVNKAFSFT